MSNHIQSYSIMLPKIWIIICNIIKLWREHRTHYNIFSMIHPPIQPGYEQFSDNQDGDDAFAEPGTQADHALILHTDINTD